LGTTVPILSKLFSGRQMAWNRICCGVTKASLFGPFCGHYSDEIDHRFKIFVVSKHQEQVDCEGKWNGYNCEQRSVIPM